MVEEIIDSYLSFALSRFQVVDGFLSTYSRNSCEYGVSLPPFQPPQVEEPRKDNNRNMASRPKITLYVDTVSPFAYEAYYILRVSSAHHRFLSC